MNKRFTRIGRILLVMVMACIMAMPSISIATTLPQYANAEYAAVLAELNLELGTDVHFPTEGEKLKYKIDVKPITMSPQEYKNYLRVLIIADREATRQAKLAELRLASMEVIDDEAGTLRYTIYYATQRKYVSGARVSLGCGVAKPSSYWIYDFIEWIDSSVIYSGSTPGFNMEYPSHRVIDSRRTCAVTLHGYTTDRNGTLLDDDALRYVEFSASDNTYS